MTLAPVLVIDIHTHVLPRLDDGAKILEDSLAMAKEALQGGVHTMVATPHIREDHDVPIDQIADRVAELSAELAEQDVPLRVLPGGEVATSVASELSDAELRLVSLGGGSRYILLEAPLGPLPISFERVVSELDLKGFVTVIAHPERNEDFRAQPQRLAALVREGALVQMTAAAVVGGLGADVRRFSLELLRGRLVHCVASDWHRPRHRASLRDAREALGRCGGEVETYARWMTLDLPQRLLADEPVTGGQAA